MSDMQSDDNTSSLSETLHALQPESINLEYTYPDGEEGFYWRRYSLTKKDFFSFAYWRVNFDGKKKFFITMNRALVWIYQNEETFLAEVSPIED